jgi:outer membrane receptor protein involved in Fe transport
MPVTAPRAPLAIKPVALAACTLALLVQHAAAQTTPSPSSTAAGTENKLEAVVVSGSRIKKDTFSTPAPIQIIKGEDTVLAGFSSTTEVLQSTSITGGQSQINNAYAGYVTDGGPGANTVGLRGFAPTRSLVLLNGRRLAPSGTRGSVGAADLNTLPGAIVDRIEVLKDGASSIYGSDAVAGVINIITKTNLTSTTVEGGFTLPEGGGANNATIAISSGRVTDRSRFMASYQFNARSALPLRLREWTQCNMDYRRTSANGVVGEWGSFDYKDPLTGQPKCYPISGTGSNGVTINTLGTSSRAGVGAPGSVGSRFNRWRPNAKVTTGVVGYEGVGGGANSLNVRDTFDPRTLNSSLISPVRNHNLYVQGGYDLQAFGDAELYYEVLFNRRDSSQIGYRQLSLDYMKGSPLIPAGLAFSTFSGPTNISNGANVGVRAFIGYGNDSQSQSVDFGRALVGMRGALPIKGWEYDVVLSHAESRGSYTGQAFLIDRMAQSLNVVANGSGGFNCVNPANGCVAAPALTPAVIGGQLPTAWTDYIFRPHTGVSKYKEDVLTASATGTLMRLPYGNLKGAFGVESRRFAIDDTPSLDSQNANILNSTTSAPTRGSDRANDVFAELDIPLLKGLPAAHELTVSASSRYANYKSYGSGSTYKVGTIWSPVKWLSARGTNGTSYRAPAVFEQYLGATTGFIASTNDPCNNWDSPTNAGTARAANCAKEGLPAGFTATSSVAVVSLGGRSSGLKAETSKNASWGIIFQPTLPTGWGDLSMALDRFDIKVDNGVARAGAGNILSRCFDDPQFRAGGGFCRLIEPRNPSSNALTVNNSYVNLATDIVRGYELTSQYTNEIASGTLKVNLSLTHYRQQANKLFAEDDLDDDNGTLRSPRRSGSLDLSYKIKDWGFYFGTEWIGKMSSYEYLGEDPATSTYKLNTPNYFQHAMSVSYGDAISKWKVTVGVRNLTNAALPSISAQAGYNKVGNAPLYSGYDYIGRRLFLNATKTF